MPRWGPHAEATELTAPAAKRQRSVLERLMLRFPGLGRRILAAVMRRRSSAVRDAILDRGHRGAYAAYSRRDWQLNTITMDRGFVFRAAELSQVVPGMDREYTGIDGYLDAQRVFLEPWPDLRVLYEGVIALEQNRTLTRVRFIGTAQLSGLQIDQEAAVLMEFRDGCAVSNTFWWDRPAAFAALGLESGARRGSGLRR